MIAKQALIEAAERAARNAARPLSAQCARALAAQLERADPPWWKAAESAWKDRYFPSPDHALLLVLAALHHEGICGRPLAAVLPTCGGNPEGLLKAVAAFLESPTPEFTPALSRRFVNYSSFWASRWLEPAQLFFQRRALPYHVVELNSAGGLGACADLLTPKEGFDSSLIRSRAAFSEAPLDLRRDADAQWLLACASLDGGGIAELAWSARLQRELSARAEAPFSCAASGADFTADIMRSAPGETCLLIVSTAWLSEQPPSKRALNTACLMELFGARSGATLWVEIDRREGSGTPALEARAYRLRDGRASRQVLTTVELSPQGATRTSDEDAAAAFLS